MVAMATDNVLPVRLGYTLPDRSQYDALVLTLTLPEGRIQMGGELVQCDVNGLASGCP